MSEMRRVTAIRNGTVVDHIPSGYAMQVIRILRINTDRATPVSLVMNVPSDKLGRKDVLKIEDRELDQEDLDRLALIAPAASIAIIRNHAVAEKMRVELGDNLVNIAKCSFPNCITKSDLFFSIFLKIKRDTNLSNFLYIQALTFQKNNIN